jgi:hypothetical protein
MERASKLIRGLGLSGDTLTPEDLACTAWPHSVGKKVAAHTRAARLVRDKLVIEVEDAIWQRQLWALRFQILNNLEKSVGPGLVSDLEFRVVPRRREPQRAETMAPALVADDANHIPHPILRSIYRQSRKKALA